MQNSKRLEYLKQNPADEQQRQTDIERGKILLRAIDTMDDYLQNYAEDTEVATATVANGILQLASPIGMGIGILPGFTKPVKNLTKKSSINIQICQKLSAPSSGNSGIDWT